MLADLALLLLTVAAAMALPAAIAWLMGEGL